MKPAHTLTHLEAEPIVFFGCKWSEVKVLRRRALYFGIGVGALISFMISLVAPLALALACFIILIGLVGGIKFMMDVKKVARDRVGKPLNYEIHLTTSKDPNLFIHPPKAGFQRERN